MSGRKVVLVFALALAAALGATITLVQALETADRLQGDVEDAWRRVAVHLDDRYRRLEKNVAEQADSGTRSLDWMEVFRLQLDAFRTSADLKSQMEAARRIETLLAQHPEVEPTVSPELRRAAAELQARIGRYRQWVEGPVAKALRWIVPQSPPAPFKLAS